MGCCAKCPKPATKRCKGCLVSSAHYCSRACQQKDWPEHKYECNSKVSSELDGADRLVRAVYRRSLPPDMRMLKEYGSVRAAILDKISELFDFWIDFIVPLEISSQSIRHWRQDSILVQIIELGYQESGRARKSQAFRWFQENSWIIDPFANGVPRGLEQETQAAVARFRQWTGYSDAVFYQIDAVKLTWPKSKLLCFDFCSDLFSHFALLPPTNLWLSFGFCVCRDYQETKKLEDIYKHVFQLLTFDEFWTARDNGSLMTLIDPLLSTYGWRRHDELRSILCTPPASDKMAPVWTLKGFILCDYAGVIRSAPSESVLLEFGFGNVRSVADTMELRRLYRRLFFDAKIPPLKLQEVAAEGDLYAFADHFLGFGKAERELFYFLLKRNIAGSAH